MQKFVIRSIWDHDLIIVKKDYKNPRRRFSSRQRGSQYMDEIRREGSGHCP